MKILIAAAVALATLAASPAFAQSYDPDIGSGNIAPPSDDPNYTAGVYQGGANAFAWSPYQGGYGAFAQVPVGRHHVQSAPAIYGLDGRFYGTDPDPNIRSQLRRESEQGEW
jgi:hypothetical protein